MTVGDRTQRRPRLPAAIRALGFVSLSMDVSSEMIQALLPFYLVATLGALSGRGNAKVPPCLGFGVLVAADLVPDVAPNPSVGMVRTAPWGLHMGMT